MPLFPTTTPNKTTPLVTDRVLLSSTPDGGEAMDASFQEILDALNIPVDSEVVHTTGNDNVAGTKTFSGIIEFAATIGRKISLTGVDYFLGLASNLFQISSPSPTTRVGIGYGATGSFIETLSVKGGNVGIGQIAPTQKLHIESSTPQVRVSLVETGDTTDAHYTGYQLLESSTFRGGFFKSGLSHDISLWTATKAVTILASNNNVGIGNTAPSEKLDVTGNIKSSGTIEALNTGGFKLGASANIVFNTTTSSIDFVIN